MTLTGLSGWDVAVIDVSSGMLSFNCLVIEEG